MLSQREDIDLERELHMVYKMFCANQAKLIRMKGLVDTPLARGYVYETVAMFSLQMKQLRQPEKGKTTNTHCLQAHHTL